jgi:perosamine synthetase
MTVRIPLARPEITDADRDAVMEVLRTPFLSTGPKVSEFERAICDYSGAGHGIAVNSGTSALQLAIRTLGIEPGAEVTLPSFTFSAVLNVILTEGLRPRFVDIDSRTYNCTAENMLSAITPATRLVIAVHTFGFPVNVRRIVDGVRTASGKTSICVIEDACEALGAELHGRKAGTLADAGVFAFYPNKQITTGEGGMLVTSDQNFSRRAAQLRSQGRDPGLGWNSHAEIGFSYRISDMNCALGISQLARIEEVVQKRKKLAEAYDRQLTSIPWIVRPPLTSSLGRISWFVYPVQLAAEFSAEDRDWICGRMLEEGIATGRYFPPLHRQPVFLSPPFRKTTKRLNPNPFAQEDMNLPGENASERTSSPSLPLPNTEFVADRVIQLPFFNELTEAEIQKVCGRLKDAIQEARRRT